MKSVIKRYLEKFNIIKPQSNPQTNIDNFPEIDLDARNIISKVQNYTMTSVERRFALINTIRYISTNQIAGDIVECGVWKGGSMMAVAYTLIQMEDLGRDLHLFDTFSGMAEPSEKDISISGTLATHELNNTKKEDEKSVWCYADLETVRTALYSTDYPKEKIHFIQGKVEDTIPDRAPDQIALLRLDTDWYESTRHELEHLFPRIVEGGVIIIDDYGHWQGAKQAVDEYIQKYKIRILLNRIDYTGRIAIVNHS
ncbi:MAG: macrocin O-methyltransferase [Pseudanabaena sp.]|nr:MAG: macrocin O-methyltransferase [Pseudanabaena sp.]